MPLHRLTDVPYNGGTFPGSHDKINDPSANGDPGVPALADGKLSVGGHVNEGTYYIGWAEDGTSNAGNRPHDALAENTDFLDDICSGDVPVPREIEGTAGSDISSLSVTGDVFVGMSGVYSPTQPFIDRLVKVLDSSTGNDLVDASGVKVVCTAIRNTADTANVVGASASGFETDPVLKFSPAIPNGATYRIILGKRSSLAAGIKDKTDLDLLVRLAIRAAQQASAETIRFITQAARRTGGNIAALSATVIETPRGLPAPGGSILPAANSLIFDVDPGSDFGGNGWYELRFNGGTSANLRIAQGPSGAGQYWANEADGIRLWDYFMDDAGADPHPLTGDQSGGTPYDGDAVLRVHDAVPATPPSIFRQINARAGIVVGDGVDTFGDFNGSDAIAQAFDYYNAQGLSNGIKIFVKAGAYEVDNEQLSSGSSIVIEGVHKDQVIITNGNGSGQPAFSTVGNSTYLELRNLTLQKDSLGGSPSTVGISAAGAVVIDNCRLIDQQLSLDRTSGSYFMEYVCVVRNSRLYMSGSTTGVPPIEILGGGTTHASHGFVFEYCDIYASQDAALLLVKNNGATDHDLSGVLFRRCTLRCAGTATNTGNLNAVVGVLELDPNGGNGTDLEDITWEDCEVTANYAGVGDNQILLYLRSHDGSNSLSVGSVTIRGGVWDAGYVDSDISPFYIGAQTVASGWGAQRVVVEDVQWGFSTGPGTPSQGAPAAEVSGPAIAGWAAFYIAAQRVKLHNVMWLKNIGLSDSGDLFLNGIDDLDVLGLIMGANNWTTGTGSAPEYRMKVVTRDLPQFGGAGIRHVTMGTAGTCYASVGLLVLSRDTGFSTTACLVSHVNLVGNASAGGSLIYVAGGATNSDEGNGWHFENCRLEESANYGFYFDWSAASLEPISDVHIRDCRVTNCDSHGIYFNMGSANKISDVNISGCLLRDNVDDGIRVDGTAPWGTNFSGLTCNNNHFDNNNGLQSNTQIFIAALSGAVGTFYGNSATEVGGAPGVLTTLSTASDDFRGTESGYTYDPTAGVVGTINHQVTTSTSTPDRRLHRGGSPYEMIHNRMRYSAP